MLADRKNEKDEMMKSKGEFEEQLRTIKDSKSKENLLSKVKFIEDELQTEFYDIIREDEAKDDLPSVVPEFKQHPAINEDFDRKTREDETRIASIKRNAEERQNELDELDAGVEQNMNAINERQEEWRRQLVEE